ncbi:hypothetical protein Tco_1205052 [Tanacetum coccineum]
MALCFCGLPAVTQTSWTDANPGHRARNRLEDDMMMLVQANRKLKKFMSMILDDLVDLRPSLHQQLNQRPSLHQQLNQRPSLHQELD